MIDEKAEAEKRKKEQMDREIEKIKKEYEEKLKQKKAKKKSKDDDKAKQDEDNDDSKTEKERDDKVGHSVSNRGSMLISDQIKAVQTVSADAPTNDGPRVFALHRSSAQRSSYPASSLTCAQQEFLPDARRPAAEH